MREILTRTAIGLSMLASQSWAVSGIGVSNYYGAPSNALRAYTVTSSKLTDSIVLCTADEVTAVALNTYGTHVAFVRSRSGTTKLSVMRVDGKNKTIKDLEQLTDAARFIDWPRGEWVYYTTDYAHTDFWRVNVQTGIKESVVKINHPGGVCEWKMSTINNLIHLDPENLGTALMTLSPTKTTVDSRNWITGGDIVGYGCTPTISPSGMYLTGSGDAGHWYHVVQKFTSGTQRDTASYKALVVPDWNSWSVDSEFACQQQPGPYLEAVGSGVAGGGCGYMPTGNSFSVNSDKWVVFNCGWQPSGRFQENSSNLVIINWMDKISMNVSRFPRTPTGSCPVGSCCVTANGYARKVTEVDFWVKEPVGDILPELQAEATEPNRAAYGIAGIDPISSVASFTRDREALTRDIMIVSCQGEGIRLPGSIAATRGDLMDMSGKIVHTSTYPVASSIVATGILKPGMYVARLMVDGTTVQVKLLATSTGTR